MTEAFPYADIVILALLAGFILLRLRSALGSKNDDNADYYNKFPTPKTDAPIVQLPEKSLLPRKDETDTAAASLPPDIAATVASIKLKDPSFSVTSFMEGAKRAFEMVFDAFKESDRQTLRMLLGDAPYQHFEGALDERAKLAAAPETTLVSVKPDSITHAALDDGMAKLTVKFINEQVTVTRDGEGKITEGDASEIHHAENEWTFERDTASKNPNWKIIET